MVEINLHPQPRALSISQGEESFFIPLVDLRSTNWEEMREAILATLVINGFVMDGEDLDNEKIKRAIQHAVFFDEPLYIEVVDDGD